MAFGVNEIIIGGNLTRDPEIRYVGSGKAVTKFCIASNTGKNDDDTTFVECVAWEKQAESINTYFKKGKPILVFGRLTIRSYEDKEGQKRKATEVVVNRFVFIPDGTRGENGSGARPQATQSNGVEDEFGDGYIPF